MNSKKRYEQYYRKDCRKPSLLSGGPGRPDEQATGAQLLIPKHWESVLSLLNKMPACLLLLSPAKGLLWANSRLLGLLNSKRVSDDGISIWQLFPKKDWQRIKEWLSADAHPQQEEIEVWFRGRNQVLLRRLPPAPGLDTKEAYLLSVEGIADVKATGELTERAFDEIQTGQEEQQRFLASVSHEIRNSAAVIAGIVRASQEGHLSHKELQHLQYTTDLLLHLTENLLYYSKIKENKFQLAQGLFNLQELLSSIAQVPLVFLQHSPVGFELRQDARLPVHCFGDKSAIYQILLNLLSNALKFTREGSIALAVNLAGKDKQGRVLIRFQVKDSGPGIPENEMDAIFGRFQQGKGFGPAKGHGLGLAISRQLAELMGGKITVESQAGQGSTFEVILPLEEAPAIPPLHEKGFSAQPDIFHCSSPARVLVLEDDPLSRSYLESFLQKEGVAYQSCANGQEALQALEANRFDLALLDLNTPLVNGYEVAINLRNSLGNPNCNIPLIALSGGHFSKEEPRLREAGISHFISKPYCTEQLRHLLWQQHLAKQQNAQMETFRFSPSFDHQELKTLYGDNYDQIQNMFEAFLRTVPKALDRMAEMLVQEDWPELAAQAHKARPSFSLVGWRQVANLAKKVEEECHNSKDKSRIKQYFLGFRRAADEAMCAVANENQRLISFCLNNTPHNYANPDRR